MERERTTWENFPETTYFLPLIEIEKRGSGMILRLNRFEERVDTTLEMEMSIQHDVNVTSRLDSPSYPVWEREVQEILQGIRKEDYLKVVLARCTRFELDRPIKPFAFLKELEGKNRFAFQFSDRGAFIALSPETLYRRKGNVVESSAVAGTRPRGKTEEEDKVLMEDLLTNPKEQHEFQVVSQMVQNALEPLCTALETDNEKVLKTPTVQHLYHAFRGKLIEGVDDQALIKALHPTPAVGGMTREKALTEIKKRERFDRGWYAGPIGWVSPDEAHHLVGIRSALIEENILHLFAGTGIVLGSVPSKEWEELEQKIRQYVNVL
jgi:menaquinone-specific isochorismate synthase